MTTRSLEPRTGKQPCAQAIFVPGELTRDHTIPTLDHIAITLGTEDFQGSRRQFVPPLDSKQLQGHALAPAPPPHHMKHTRAMPLGDPPIGNEDIGQSLLTEVPINVMLPVVPSYPMLEWMTK
jgi:hypothetical protein